MERFLTVRVYDANVSCRLHVQRGSDKKTMNPRVSIIILNWNNWQDTLKCLESLDKIDYSNYDVIIVDNGSQDDSLKRIRSWAGPGIRVVSNPYVDNAVVDPLAYAKHDKTRADSARDESMKKAERGTCPILIKNEKNYGFSGGNNIGARYALENLDPEYIYLLNNDTTVHKEFLTEIVKQGKKEHARVGMLQSKVMCMDNTKMLDSAGGMVTRMGAGGDRGAWEIDRRLYDDDLEIFYAKGAALMIKTDVVRQVGLFDPKFVIYYEDTDLGWRVNLAGYKVLYSPNSIVYHAGGRTMNRQRLPKVLYVKKKNQIAMLIKNYDDRNLARYLVIRFLNDIFRRILLALKNAVARRFSDKWRPDLSSTALGPTIHAYLWNVAHFRYFWRERLWNQRIIRKVPDSVLPFWTRRRISGTEEE
ncbi:MAG: glycosyltransferase family 2 protein [Promethearchaeati archaeon SRVP18_Atabeyarchaeia-1]